MTANSNANKLDIDFFLDSNDIVSNGGLYNRLERQIPQSLDLRGKEAGLVYFSTRNSFPNIKYTGTTLDFVWIDGQTGSISLPKNSNWSPADLNAYIEATMLAYGWCFQSTTDPTDILYYYNVQANEAFYSIDFLSTPLPAAVPSGYAYVLGSKPAWITSARNPQFNSVSTEFTEIYGLPAGLHPPAQTPAAIYTYQTMNPQVGRTSIVKIRCNIIQNRYAKPFDLIGVKTVDKAYGQDLTLDKDTPRFFPCKETVLNEIIVELVDDIDRPLQLMDRKATVQIFIRDNR